MQARECGLTAGNMLAQPTTSFPVLAPRCQRILPPLLAFLLPASFMSQCGVRRRAAPSLLRRALVPTSSFSVAVVVAAMGSLVSHHYAEIAARLP